MAAPNSQATVFTYLAEEETSSLSSAQLADNFSITSHDDKHSNKRRRPPYCSQTLKHLHITTPILSQSLPTGPTPPSTYHTNTSSLMTTSARPLSTTLVYPTSTTRQHYTSLHFATLHGRHSAVKRPPSDSSTLLKESSHLRPTVFPSRHSVVSRCQSSSAVL